MLHVEVGGRSEALNESDGTGSGWVALEPRLLDEKSGNDPVDDLQDGREQLATSREEHAQWDRNERTHCRTGTRGIT